MWDVPFPLRLDLPACISKLLSGIIWIRFLVIPESSLEMQISQNKAWATACWTTDMASVLRVIMLAVRSWWTDENSE